MTTDILVTTYNRLPLLRRTVEYIVERTQSPYQLHIVDDASTEGNRQYIEQLWRDGIVQSYIFNEQNLKERRALAVGYGLISSDPFVIVDDDILCPDVEPDWLARGLDIMCTYPQIGILALNNAECNLQPSRKLPLEYLHKFRDVTISLWVGGTFAFVRRCLWEKLSFDLTTKLGPIKQLCMRARELGLLSGYITNTYCLHLGNYSIRRGCKLADGYTLAEVDVDPKTLVPNDTSLRG